MADVRPIFEKFPALQVPFTRIAELPTPVERMKKLSRSTGAEIWIKRDNLTHREYGGNKVRKCEFLSFLAKPDGTRRNAEFWQRAITERILLVAAATVPRPT